MFENYKHAKEVEQISVNNITIPVVKFMWKQKIYIFLSLPYLSLLVKYFTFFDLIFFLFIPDTENLAENK